ncbi:hypothetical protein BDZ94DRAFT_1300485 [Collybia nuda]|uniref:NACHT domain-containing protein n=1 Tax=Collybia nuda TaxID=64659 RepID=A0A9P5XXE8_9AGAR|nr:hypothetical protein BDZ94DRAFT_1300485 [Collybia nuda]
MASSSSAGGSSDPHGTPQSGTSYFGGAHDFQIVGSRLTEVHGNQIINDASGGLKHLFKSISPGATHDSAERSSAPRCYENTRVSVINEIMTWINEKNRERSLLWLNGAPGVGKSAISQTIAERCAETGQLAGSYFFSGESTDRKTAERFFFTLAYQFSVVIPEFRAGIETELKNDPHILSKSMRHQLDRLILQPLSQPIDLPPMVIVVDGLDECNAAGQAAILGLIPTLLSGLPSSLCLVIASRPEAFISDTFSSCLGNLSRRVTLDARYAPDKDIETFLRTTLTKIARRRLSQPWPSDGDIRLLVAACSGQFLCAGIILRYISDGPQRPDKMLTDFLNITGSKHAALTPLDNLYSQILSTCPDPTHLLKILGVILVSSCRVGFIEDLLGLEPGDVTQQLRSFNSVLQIPRPGDKIQAIRIRQPSFREYLLDPLRSGSYFIDAQKEHSRIAMCMLRMHKQPNVTARLLETSREYWGYHCSEATPTDDLVLALRDFDLRSWLKKSGEESYHTSDLAGVMAWMLKNSDHSSLNNVHIKWIKICYEAFCDDLKAFGLRPSNISVSTFMALSVVASITTHLDLDASIVCSVLEPFVSNSEILWLTLDARIGIRSPFEPNTEEFYKVSEHFYYDTLDRRTEGHVAIHLDAQKLKASDGTILPRFDLETFNAFGRFQFDSAKSHTHFALACLAYVRSTASRSRRWQTNRPHVHEVQADRYAWEKWAYHISMSLPTQAVLANLRDFIHEDHSQVHKNEKLMTVIQWLKGLEKPPLKLISCWESALRKVDCGETHSRTASVSSGPTPYRLLATAPPLPTPPTQISAPGKRKHRSWLGISSTR